MRWRLRWPTQSRAIVDNRTTIHVSQRTRIEMVPYNHAILQSLPSGHVFPSQIDSNKNPRRTNYRRNYKRVGR